ncbi:ABC transporter ATP-binding protein [Corynebacterium lowii]|uniref:Putative HMP/thiamine import ATP-binding protein YkoD n=1 Tax=Corynebacterium lowii TaxID=1544413 RepID=A0A0Q0YI12_9CORY|nr:ABC transporter ATP-binding protein [Corynebacterium lowii]KQB86270.1 putative HMP/thiamine import ATP-binding protein YkoD [Corynebacterium lowii]MDP9850755.1 energy-coupling factor transport system ATP-binding protein [Corynebacterium lowii]
MSGRKSTGRGSICARDFGWRHATRKNPALSGIDLDVAPGERVLLSGDSGAGKSTLLGAIAGLLGGADDGERTGSLAVEGVVGLVLQDPDSQVIASRVGDDVAFGCENLGVPREEIWRRVHQALDLVGLHLPLDTPTRYLSGGQKQRLALAGVVAMGADIVLLDEPTANLDPAGYREVRGAVDKLVERTGATVIIVEHRTDLWRDFATRFIHLSAQGAREITAEELPQRPHLPAAQPERARAEALLSAEAISTVTGTPHSLSLPRGASTVLTGPNGAGKTQLAMVLGGLDAPRSGSLRLHPDLAQGLKTPPHRWRSKDLARRIGTVFQNPEHQFVARTVEEDLLVGGPAERAEELMERLRLGHLRKANPYTLSGGEKRRLSVATALMGAPGLVVLDEPTFGQDSATFAELTVLLRELTEQGTTVFSITHDEDFVHTLGDQHLDMKHLGVGRQPSAGNHSGTENQPSTAPTTTEPGEGQ